jgi:hypothetical protein
LLYQIHLIVRVDGVIPMIFEGHPLMRHLLRNYLLAALAAFVAAPLAFGQGIVTQWTFPPGFDLVSPAPSTGSGTASRIGGTSATSAADIINDAPTSVAWNISTYPAQSTNSGTAGTQYLIDTTGQNNLIFRFDHRHSNTASRFHDLQYTTDGGSTWTTFETFQPYALNGAGGDRFNQNRTFDLSGVAGVNNNPNFGVRIVSVFDPSSGTEYTASNAASSYGTAGTFRLDNVTLTAANVWIGGSGTDIATGANYAGSAAPGANATIAFGNSSNTTITTSAPLSVDQFLFQNGGSAYTISGNDTISLTAGVINNSGNDQLISNPLDLSGRPQAFANNTGGTAITLGGNVTLSAIDTLATNGSNPQLKIAGAGDFVFNGVVSGGVTNDPAIIKTGEGRLFLNNTGNTFVGSNFGSGTNAAVAVLNGAVGGTGNVPGGVLLARPEASVIAGSGTATGETFTVGNLRFTDDSSLRSFVGNGAVGPDLTTTGASLLNVTGELSTAAAADTINIILTLDGSMALGTTYTRQLATYGSLSNITPGTYTSSDTKFTVVSDTIPIASDWTVFVGSGVIQITFTPVPEPGTVLAIGAAGLGLAGWYRRRGEIFSRL